MAKAFVNSDQVADMLGLSDGAAFLRRRERLETEDLFPLPMPTSRRSMLWKRDEVQAWVDIHGCTPTSAPMIDPELIRSGKVAMLELARTA